MNKKRMIAALNKALEPSDKKSAAWAGLVSGLVQAGFKIVPEDLWDDLSKALASEEGSMLIYRASRQYPSNLDCGFVVFENHDRSHRHEVWQSKILPNKVNGSTNRWVIPVDELICLSYDNSKACDFTSITRLVFVGTESKLREAVARLITDVQQLTE